MILVVLLVVLLPRMTSAPIAAGSAAAKKLTEPTYISLLLRRSAELAGVGRFARVRRM
jgi:hypothetical protein